MTLVVPVTPMPDENIVGLLARAAGANVYPRTSDILDQLVSKRMRPESIGLHEHMADELASVLGSDTTKLKRLFTPSMGSAGVNFFGMPLRQIYREKRARRVSPLALRQAPYIRAIWSVTPFIFDPGTRETLISRCPVCDMTLGFVRTWGVEFCENCLGEDEFGLPVSKVDLRDFPQPLIEVNDEDALDFVVALVDPNMHDLCAYDLSQFSNLTRSELFDMTLSLAAMVSWNRRSPEAYHTDIPRRELEQIDPDCLAVAGRAILSWPEGFVSLCGEAQKDAHRREGIYGPRKEFGIFANLARDQVLSPHARDLARSSLEQAFANLKPQEGIARKYPFARSVGKYIRAKQIMALAPVHQRFVERMRDHPEITTFRSTGSFITSVTFETDQVASVLTEYMDLMSEDKLAWALGLPPDGVRDLAAFMNIPTSGSAQIARDLDLGEGPYYPKHTAEEILDILRTGIEMRRPPDGFVSFREAMLMFPAGRRPWRPVLEAILFEKVKAVYRTRSTKALLNGIWVKGIDAIRDDILFEHRKACQHDIDAVSIGAATLMLGITHHAAAMACFDNGLLAKNENGQVRYDSVLAFADRYIFSNEASVRSRNNKRTIRAWLASNGIQPAYDLNIKGGLIYDREKVEPLLEMQS